MKQEINRIIIDEIAKLKMDRIEKEMLADILFFERQNMDLKEPRFKDKFKAIIEREE